MKPTRVCAPGRPCREGAACRYALPAGRCAILVANEGEHSLPEIAELLGEGIGRSRVGQILADAMRKLRKRVDLDDLEEHLD